VPAGPRPGRARQDTSTTHECNPRADRRFRYARRPAAGCDRARGDSYEEEHDRATTGQLEGRGRAPGHALVMKRGVARKITPSELGAFQVRRKHDRSRRLGSRPAAPRPTRSRRRADPTKQQGGRAHVPRRPAPGRGAVEAVVTRPRARDGRRDRARPRPNLGRGTGTTQRGNTAGGSSVPARCGADEAMATGNTTAPQLVRRRGRAPGIRPASRPDRPRNNRSVVGTFRAMGDGRRSGEPAGTIHASERCATHG
jgi:hypothetical protein